MAPTTSYKVRTLQSALTEKLVKYAEPINISTLIIMSIIVNLQYFSSEYYPVHDTLTIFHFFSHYYSQILTTNEFPLWLPYTAYGIPIESYILFSFGPFQYLALAIGYLFNIQNTLDLFSISIIGDTLFLAFGTYLFCNHIFKDRIPTMVCVIFILLLAQYDQQMYWNFKILIPVPMTLYLAQKWLESLNLNYFITGMAMLLIWSFGALPYVIPFQFYVAACYGTFLILPNIKFKDLNLKNFIAIYQQTLSHLKQKNNKIISIFMLSILSICALMMTHIKHVMKNELTYSTNFGRNADLSVPVDSYLHHGGFYDSSKILEMLNGIPYTEHHFLPFAGMICIMFATYSLFCKKKSNSHIALIMTTIFVLSFSVISTQVAHIAYYLPKMNLFRHVGYVVTIGKILLIILSGYGIRAYLHKK
jgi:hypothetical protein